MKALYRKYRPCRLEDVVGQEQVTDALNNMLKTSKFCHAFLFAGPRGCGKTSVARIFAHAINNFKYELEDEYVDIVEIDAASNTGVDNIRELREKATIVPTEGKYKVYIIDEIHMLSRSAFNALLKTLEEPPAHVIFIMATTDPEKIPATILSRTQTYSFKLVEPSIMLDHLTKIAEKEKIKIDKEALEIIVRRGGGSFRDSLSLLDQISSLSDKNITAEDVTNALGLPSDEIVNNILAAYKNSDFTGISEQLKYFYNTGGGATALAEHLIAKILENPEPIYFSLLAKLPEVKEPFSEARLLLCFTGETTESPRMNWTSTPAPKVPTASTPKKPTTTNPTPKATPAPKGPENTPEPQKATESIPEPKPETASKPETQPQQTPSTISSDQNFDFNTLLRNVQNSSARLYSLLRACGYDFSDNTLTIYPTNGLAKKSLERPDASKILADALGDEITIKISDKKAPAYSQISDIMGDVQEVNDGGIPF